MKSFSIFYFLFPMTVAHAIENRKLKIENPPSFPQVQPA